MPTSIKGVLLATALVFGAVLAAAAANAQSATSSDEAQPMPMLEISPSEIQSSSHLTVAPPIPVGLRPIHERTMGGPVGEHSVDDLKPFTGKLFMKLEQDNTEIHYCTAQFVLPRVIVTAAHCVQENGTSNKYTLLHFKRETEDIVYEIEPNCFAAPEEWAAITDEYLRINYDYAFIKVGRELTIPLKAKLMESNPYNLDVRAVGYPASIDPNALTSISTDVRVDVLHPPLVELETTSLGFTEGTSGGAWVRDQGSGTHQYRVVSVNSSYAIPIYNKSFIRIYGANLQKSAGTLLNQANGLANCDKTN